MRVKLLPADRTGCGMYRMIYPGEACLKAGYDVVVSDNDTDRYVVQRMSDNSIRVHSGPEVDADVVVMQRPATNKSASMAEWYKRQGARLVVEIDDHFHRLSPRNQAWHAYQTADQNITWLNQTLALADKVVVSTPALADAYQGELMENCVPHWYLSIGTAAHQGDWPTQLGWAGSLSVHRDDLAVVGMGVADALRRTGWEFHVVGESKGVGYELHLDEDPPCSGWLPIEDYPKHVAGLGAAIAPIADTAFNRAKCLDASTRISTGRGILPVGEVQPGDVVYRSGSWMPVEAVSHEIPTAGVEVGLRSGRRIRLTNEHRMQTTSGDWIEAGSLVVGDILAGEPEDIADVDRVVVPWPATSRKSRGAVFDVMRFATDPPLSGPTVALDERWGRILGVFVGDGGMSGSTQREPNPSGLRTRGDLAVAGICRLRFPVWVVRGRRICGRREGCHLWNQGPRVLS